MPGDSTGGHGDSSFPVVPPELGLADGPWPDLDLHGAITWVALKPGTFMMGSPDTEPCRLANEVLHQVTLSRGFEISSTEITQAVFQLVMGTNPSQFKGCGGDCPVDSSSWSDAVVFSNYLSERDGRTKCYSCVAEGGKYKYPYDCRVRSIYDGPGKTIYDCPGYRLPTEAEWEYAYRAGTSTALHNGPISSCSSDSNAGAIGWYSKNSSSSTQRTAQKKPNLWGIHDMAGNVWEWVNDWYASDLGSQHDVDPLGPASGSAKVLRGGAWLSSPGSVRGATRNQNVRSKAFPFIGFRVVRGP